MASSNTRFLFVPELEITPDKIVSVENASGDREEASPTVEQPEAPSTGSLPGGDIRLTLSGEPDGVHQNNTARVTLPATLDEGRFGWAQDPAGDLQLKQSMLVCGRRTDAADFLAAPDPSFACYSRPRGLALNSGSLLGMWLKMTTVPQQAGLGVGFRYAVLDADGTWSQQATDADTALDQHSAFTDGISGFDFVQYPDTDEIVLLSVEYDIVGTPLVMFCYVSADDGVTWVERRRLFFGAGNDLTLTDGVFTDTSEPTNIAVRLLDNGRMVAVLTTKEAAWALISDDRGRTWEIGKLLEDWSAAGSFWGASVSGDNLRNGFLFFVVVRPDDNPAARSSVMFGYGTLDGVTWGTKHDLVFHTGAAAASFVVRPDGWPCIYAAVHHTEITPDVFHDWLAGFTSNDQDFTLNTGGTAAWDLNFNAFHCNESTPSGRLDVGPVFQGPEGLDAVVWRGQTIIFSSVQSMDPTFGSCSIMLQRLSHWQPLQEQLSLVSSVPATPARGRMYNRTFDCYDTGGLFGWTLVGAGADAISSPTIDGGYLRFQTVVNTRYYEDTTLPASLGGQGCAIRFLVRVALGGSLTTDDVALRFEMSDGINSIDVSVRFELSGGFVNMSVYDNHAAADITQTNPAFVQTGNPSDGNWIEVILATKPSTPDIEVYARSHDPDADPEWDGSYTLVVADSLTSASGPTDLLRFGNIAASTAKSDWKTVQLERISGGSPDLVIQSPTLFEDTDSTGTVKTSGSTALALRDAGIDNYMRTPKIAAIPSQYITGGVSATFRGEATLTGNYDYETAYDYSRDNLLEGPVVQEWRNSNNTSGVSEDIEILIDMDPGAAPGAGNLTAKPTGLAIFGRNWTSCRFQMNDTDAWGSPRVDVTYGTPNDLLTPDRYTHMWSSDETLFTSVIAGRQLVCFRTADTFGPWRASQFRSQETGPWYYVMIQDITGDDPDRRMIYRILDNDEGMLTLDGDPEADGLDTLDPIKFDIFSDRFAVFLGDRHSALSTTYRYIKITIYGVNHRGPDEDFQRVGRIVLGYAHDMSLPMFDWGWQRAESSGSGIAEGSNGVRYATRNHSPRRQFNCTYRLLRAPLEADAVSESPETSWRSGQNSWIVGGGGSPKTWGHVVDLLRRLEIDGKRCALIWEGDRADDVGSGSSVVQTAADPMELLMVRVTNVGPMRHVGYEAQDKNLADGDECKPTPMMTQTYTFEEDF